MPTGTCQAVSDDLDREETEDTGALDLQRILSALASPVRREILWLVWDEELPAGKIFESFDLSAATISEHLAILRDARLLNMHRSGTSRRYRTERTALEVIRPLLGNDEPRWVSVGDAGGSPLASAKTAYAVVGRASVGIGREAAFRAFVDDEIFARWLGAEVSLDDEMNFEATMEWGTRIHGTYDSVVDGSMIVLRWGFQDDQSSAPMTEMPAYLRFTDSDRGCTVEVSQLFDDPARSEFMQAVWTLVLGRFADGVKGAVGDAEAHTDAGRQSE